MLGSVADWDVADVKIPAAPGSLMRAAQICHLGLLRISRRDAELYSVQITSSGAWARLRVFDGDGRLIFIQSSTFTGSFWLGAGCRNGIIVSSEAQSVPPTVAINFREKDSKLV